MKRSILLFLIFTSVSLHSQTIDYNTKKGFAANGYDVVAYFKNEAIEGNKKLVFEYDGIKYKFASEQNLKSFKSEPERYIPQYGGYCAYAVALKNNKVSINPESFQIKDDKLYLFYNAWGTNTLELWQKEDEVLLIKKATENWKKIKFKK